MMRRVPIIMITGKKGSGKNTYADFLVDALSEGFRVATRRRGVFVDQGFADPLKAMVSDAFGFPTGWCNDGDRKKTATFYGKTLRHWLQWFGTEVFRNGVDPDFWVHRMLRVIAMDRGVDAWIITDWRFPNEFSVLKSYLVDRVEYFIPTDIHRPSPLLEYVLIPIKIRRAAVENSDDHHVSEKSIDLLDEFAPMVVENDGAIYDLYHRAFDDSKAILKQMAREGEEG